MHTTPSALLIDDDPDAIALLEYALRRRFPELSIESRVTPETKGDFDVYFVDNEFHSRSLAGALAETIRSRQPDSLIIAFSARLDACTLKRLINAGCDWAFDKTDPEDLKRMLEIVAAFLQAGAAEPRGSGRARGLLPAINSITELIRQWNTRLGSGIPA